MILKDFDQPSVDTKIRAERLDSSSQGPELHVTRVYMNTEMTGDFC